MKRAWILRPAGVAVLVLSAMMASYATSEAAPKSEDEKPKRPRMPAYVARVVNDEQRTEIGEIQLDYASKIEKLRGELQALIDERDAKIDKVLTPSQRKEVQKLRDEAAAKRKDSSSGASETKTNSKTKAKQTSKKTEKDE